MMTVRELHDLTGHLLQAGYADLPVLVQEPVYDYADYAYDELLEPKSSLVTVSEWDNQGTVTLTRQANPMFSFNPDELEPVLKRKFEALLLAGSEYKDAE